MSKRQERFQNSSVQDEGWLLTDLCEELDDETGETGSKVWTKAKCPKCRKTSCPDGQVSGPRPLVCRSSLPQQDNP